MPPLLVLLRLAGCFGRLCAIPGSCASVFVGAVMFAVGVEQRCGALVMFGSLFVPCCVAPMRSGRALLGLGERLGRAVHI